MLRNMERKREWSSVCESMSEEAFGDWPVRGPRTTMWCCQFMGKRHNPLDHHLMFRSTANLQVEQWGVSEHATMMRLIETAAVYDQLDISNCAWAEVAFRRAQVIEWAYSDKIRESESKGEVLGNMAICRAECFRGSEQGGRSPYGRPPLAGISEANRRESRRHHETHKKGL